MPSNVSIVKNSALAGTSLPALLENYREELVGKSVYARFGNNFPLLVKFIDAEDDLSIQVHPDDALALEKHDSYGKTEMWYVVQADEGATLVAGFNRQIQPKVYLEMLGAGKLNDILSKEVVAAGDVFFLPAGRIHAIGKGILLAEIQQASDVTYRIHDFDRFDDMGNKRPLHTEEALAVLDFDVYPAYKTVYARTLNAPVKVVECAYFTTNILEFKQLVIRDYPFDSFVIHVCVQGAYTLSYGGDMLEISMGECVLVPASILGVKLETVTGATLLECFLV